MEDILESTAQQLTDARRAVTLLDSLGKGTPDNIASAYAIAERHAVQLGWATIGWKVGCTSEEAMQILNSPGPFAGRVFDGTVYGSGEVHESAMHNPGLESEFAFFLGIDLPPINREYTVDEVRAATKFVAPAIELVAPRMADFTGVGYLSLVADSGANGGVVLGAPVMTSDCPALAEVTVELEIDGAVVKTGSGDAILGDPWRALQWLANNLSDRGITLHAGEFVMSGTCTGIDPLLPGSVATGRYSGFDAGGSGGSVSLTRTPAQ